MGRSEAEMMRVLLALLLLASLPSAEASCLAVSAQHVVCGAQSQTSTQCNAVPECMYCSSSSSAYTSGCFARTSSSVSDPLYINTDCYPSSTNYHPATDQMHYDGLIRGSCTGVQSGTISPAVGKALGDVAKGIGAAIIAVIVGSIVACLCCVGLIVYCIVQSNKKQQVVMV